MTIASALIWGFIYGLILATILKLVADSKEAKRHLKEMRDLRAIYDSSRELNDKITEARIKWAKDDVAHERRMHDLTRQDNQRLREDLATARERSHQLQRQLTQELGRQTITGELVVNTVEDRPTAIQRVADLLGGKVVRSNSYQN